MEKCSSFSIPKEKEIDFWNILYMYCFNEETVFPHFSKMENCNFQGRNTDKQPSDRIANDYLKGTDSYPCWVKWVVGGGVEADVWSCVTVTPGTTSAIWLRRCLHYVQLRLSSVQHAHNMACYVAVEPLGEVGFTNPSPPLLSPPMAAKRFKMHIGSVLAIEGEKNKGGSNSEKRRQIHHLYWRLVDHNPSKVFISASLAVMSSTSQPRQCETLEKSKKALPYKRKKQLK